jgi:LysM repeat protein
MRSTWIGIGMVAVATGAGLASCGGDDGGSAATTVAATIGATNFVTVPPATTTTIDPGVPTTPAPGGEFQYVVQAGDYPSTIATKFGVPFQDLLTVNGWTLEGQQVPQFTGPGQTITIPAGGTQPTGDTGGASGGAATTAAPGAGTATTAAGATATTVATTSGSGDNCAPGTYTILAEDTSRLRVAQKFDVTVEALDAANAGTDGYSAFYPGLEIVIPAKADC